MTGLMQLLMSSDGTLRVANPRGDVYDVTSGLSITGPTPSGDMTGATDTAAVLARLTTAQASGGTLILQAGDYYFTTGTLVTPASPNQPKIIGQGFQYTRLHLIGSGSGIIITGGSGQQSGGYLSDVTLMGGTGAVGLELRGVDGFTYERVHFDATLGTGVKHNNATAGMFTEFCVGHSCVFHSATAVAYSVGAGTASFHGSGIRDAVIVQPALATVPTISIGAGAKVYNAPLDGMMFLNTPAVSPIKNGSALNATTFGVVRVENDGATGVLLDPASTAPIYHAGEVTTLGLISLGTFALVNHAQYNGDGSVTANRKPWTTDKAVTTGANTIFPSMVDGMSYLVNVMFTAANYSYEYDLVVYNNWFDGTGTVTVLQNGQAFNTAGYGAAAFSVAANGLVATNAGWPANGVTANISITEIGSRHADPMR